MLREKGSFKSHAPRVSITKITVYTQRCPRSVVYQTFLIFPRCTLTIRSSPFALQISPLTTIIELHATMCQLYNRSKLYAAFNNRQPHSDGGGPHVSSHGRSTGASAHTPQGANPTPDMYSNSRGPSRAQNLYNDFPTGQPHHAERSNQNSDAAPQSCRVRFDLGD
jgi:hypothetical protein